MQELAVSTGNRDHFSQQKRMVLEQERDQLEALLEEKELQMEALKKSVEALNADYSADLSQVQQVRYLVILLSNNEKLLFVKRTMYILKRFKIFTRNY